MSNTSKHTDKYYEKELDTLKEKLLCMANLVETAIAKSIKALKERDDNLADVVLKEDEKINMLEIEIEEQCLGLLALRQPIAVDLRFIASSMKINNDLERMGDLAVNIVYNSKEILKRPPLKPLIDIPRMAVLTQSMLRDSLKALINSDTLLARDVCRRDDEVDLLNHQIFRELLTYMMEDNKSIHVAVNLILVGRHLERIADLSTNIAEEVVYMFEGKSIKHRVEERVLRQPMEIL